MPVDESRCVPEHQRKRQIQRQRDPHRGLKIAAPHHLFGDLAADQIKLGKLPAVNQRRYAHHGQKTGGIQAAQDHHGPLALLAGAKGANQDGGHRELSFAGLLGGRHQAQCGGRQQRQRQCCADEGHQCGQRQHGHKHEKQAGHGQRLTEEGLDAQLDPQEAGACRNDIEFHGVGFSRQFKRVVQW